MGTKNCPRILFLGISSLSAQYVCVRAPVRVCVCVCFKVFESVWKVFGKCLKRVCKEKKKKDKDKEIMEK